MYFFFAMTKKKFFKYQQRGEAELLVSRASGTNAASARFPGYGGEPPVWSNGASAASVSP